MARKATKALTNVFYKARIEAAKFNDSLNSREGTSETIGIDRSRLARMELNNLNPYPEEVLLLAELYNAPELNNYYCCNLCPIGKKNIQKIELCQIERIAIQILSVLNKNNIDNIRENLIDIVADGEVTKDEIPRLKKIIDILNTISVKAETLKIWAQKYLILKEEKHEDNLAL